MAIRIVVPAHLEREAKANRKGVWTFDFLDADYKIYGTFREVSVDVRKSFKLNHKASYGEINVINFK